MGRLAVSIQTSRPTTDWAMGRAILAAFCGPDPRLTPEALSVWSTQHDAFTGIDACERLWATSTDNRVEGRKWTVTFGLGWRRAHTPQYRAEIANHSGTNLKGTPVQGRLALDAPFHRGTDWQGLFTRLCDVMGASEGILAVGGTAERAHPAPLAQPSQDYAGAGSVIALPPDRVNPDHRARLDAAGFDVTALDTCLVIALLPGLADAKDASRLAARRADLAAILNDGTWKLPKRPSWWDGR